MKALRPRDYQRETIDKVTHAWTRMRRPAYVHATGLGKSVVIAHQVSEWLERNPGRRALVLQHRLELVRQNAGKLRDVAPDLSVGVVMANRNETLADVLVGSVQTLASESRRRQLRDVGLVVVDECHHSSANTYMDILGHYGCFADGVSLDDGAQAVGCTATMTRGDSASLGEIWQDVVDVRSLAWGVAAGWLVRPVGVRVQVDTLDLSKVRKQGGDYSKGDLGKAIEASLAPEAIVRAVREHAADRPTLVFMPTIRTAEIVAEAFTAGGFTAAAVHSKMSTEERTRNLDDLRAGRVQVIVNAMVLTEGTDLPMVGCIVIGRPTTNVGLYLQIVGRGVRPDPNNPHKRDCIVIDVVGATERHGLITPVDLFGDDAEDAKESEPGDVEESEGRETGEVTLDDVGVDGPLVSHEVDLFHGSDSAWLQTTAGIWFLAMGERFVAIVPGREVGVFDVVSMHHSRVGESDWVARDVSSRGYAQAWAEAAATPTELSLVRRDRHWRARRPSEAQRAIARDWDVVVPRGATAGEVSSLVKVAAATDRIDSRLPAHAREALGLVSV